MVSRLALITAVRSLTISNISRTVRCLLMLVIGFSASGSRREAADIVSGVERGIYSLVAAVLFWVPQAD